MDFDDAEQALRAAARGYHGWTFEQFLASRDNAPALVRGDSGELYQLDVDVPDCRGDLDAREELVQLAFTVRERAPGARFRSLVNARAALRCGHSFSGEVTQVTRVTAESQRRSHRRLRVAVFGAGLALLAVLLRCLHASAS